MCATGSKRGAENKTRGRGFLTVGSDIAYPTKTIQPDSANEFPDENREML